MCKLYIGLFLYWRCLILFNYCVTFDIRGRVFRGASSGFRGAGLENGQKINVCL